MIIGINGKIGSGKDTIGLIIQALMEKNLEFSEIVEIATGQLALPKPDWEIKKYADKLKEIVCLLIGCTREQLEDREFKEKELGEEWNYVLQDGIPLTVDQVKRDKEFPFNERYIQRLTPRLLLQLLGTDCGRNIIHPNIWVNALMSEYKITESYRGVILNKGVFTDIDWKSNNAPNWIITDMRFPNELKAVKDRDGITIRVNRYDITGQGKLNPHSSETALDDAEFDYEIINDGTIEDLIKKVKKVLLKEKLI